MVHIFRGLSNRFQHFLAWMWEQKGTPAMRARGFAVGVFSGCFPLFGLQTIMGVALAALFRGNPLLAAIGTWISNPITYLPLYWFNYQVGCFFLGKGPVLPNLEELTFKHFWSHGWLLGSRILLGSALVGAIIAILMGAVVYTVSRILSSSSSTIRD